MELTGFKAEDFDGHSRTGLCLMLSIALHMAIISALAIWLQHTAGAQLVAAGPGEGGEGGGGSIEVGVADPSTILGFAKPQPVSSLGNQDNPINNLLLSHEKRKPEQADQLLPPSEEEIQNPKAIKTDRPVADQQERIFTGKQELGRSASASAQVGHSYGSPIPVVRGGVGIGSGGGFGAGTGLPGGSEYGRRIQMILSRNYNPPEIESSGVQYVIIQLRIARDGRILSLVGGRVASAYFKQKSPFDQLNKAAERALLASDPLPPFPPGFLAGAQEAVAEVWFRYPK
jgi:hypothetical protein